MSEQRAHGPAGHPTLQIEDAVARIRLNRPDQHNRFEPADIETMAVMLRELSARRAVRVVVITARGPSFSSGFDLQTLSSDRARESTAAFASLCDTLEALPIPTICGLNGNVYGGATDFALACDIRIAVEGACLTMSPARLGIEYYHSGLRRYVERLGLSEATRLFLTGDQINSAEMLRIGFLNEITAADALEPRLSAIALMLAQRSPVSLRGLKASLNAIARGTGDAGAINVRFFDSLTSSSAQEGLRAWIERRLPRFADP